MAWSYYVHDGLRKVHDSLKVVQHGQREVLDGQKDVQHGLREVKDGLKVSKCSIRYCCFVLASHICRYMSITLQINPNYIDFVYGSFLTHTVVGGGTTN